MQVDRSCVVSSAWCACLLLLYFTISTRVTEVGATHQSIPPSVVKLWASAFGGEMKSISAKYSGSQLLQKKYKEFERAVRVEEIDGLRLVKRLAEDMEEMFHKKAQAMKRLVEAAEEAHLQHEEDPDLQYEYFNAVLINEVDEEGNSAELGGEFILQPNDHFNNLSVNLSLSVVQVPTNMYNKDSAIVNGVFWSEALNKVFVDNFERDPSLIWQYFGSAKGFFRQYPENGPAYQRKIKSEPFGWQCDLLYGGVVRIFPYLIGRESAFADNLKWMACANKGYFTQISTLADVQENVMEYLHVLSRPKVIDREHDTVWTEAYIDNTLPQAQKMEDGQSPVLMTTVAMPVFSTKNETRNRGILLGVVGTDVPVSELLKTIPKYKLGIHGYAFAITNNGYILTHPDLRPLYGDGKKRRKPNYSSVDLSEVEWEDKDDTLRNAMVNRKTGIFSMEVKKSVDKGKRVLVLHNDYYYTDIKGTPFSLGVALSRGHGKFFFRGNVTVEEGLHDLEHPDVALADEWTYCNTDEHPEHRYLSQIEAIKLYLSGHEPHLQCDKELIQEVLFDAVVTAPLEAYWTSLVLNKSENSDKGVEIAYLGTRTGLSRINMFVVPDQLTNQDFLTAEDKEGVFNADHFPLWYKRAAEQVPGTFVYSLPFNTGSENKSVVLASTAIQLLDERKSPIAAAVGIQMKLEFFQRKFWTASRQCAALDGKCSISCDDENINCYLIDNNGFILVAEDYTLTGKFFGEAEGAVMSKLLQMGSFKRVTLYDYQALCWVFSESSGSGHTLLDPYFAFFSAVKWILTELVIFLVEFNLYSWWYSDITAKAQRLGRTTQVPCDTEYPAFVSERTIKENTGNIDCDGCIKSFVIQQIPSSNLFMVVVDSKCDCSMFEPITMDPIEIMYNESLKCERLKMQKDRRRPDTCHPFHPEENSMECGGAGSLTPSLAAMLLCFLLALFPR
nr:PREDICTED: voltage-dependent calcium channel subunit alpha-2/delta-3-like [Paralichthys olivaceus]